LNAGIVIRQEDMVARSKAAKCGMSVDIRSDWALPWPRTLFIAPGTCVPWDLVAVGISFLARWDVAAPFWRAGTLAKDLGTAAERERTAAILHDLRVPVYSHELLFVRKSAAGEAFLSSWRAECGLADKGGDERLAFLRALYTVKPAFCVLPRLWLADLAQREVSDRQVAHRHAAQHGEPLIRVEIAPGRFVRCHEGDRAQILERYQKLAGGRHRR
jgi:hypothetical protein